MATTKKSNPTSAPSKKNAAGRKPYLDAEADPPASRWEMDVVKSEISALKDHLGLLPFSPEAGQDPRSPCGCKQVSCDWFTPFMIGACAGVWLCVAIVQAKQHARLFYRD